MEAEPSPAPDRNWTFYIVLFVLISVAAIAISLMDSAQQGAEPEGPSYSALMAGDFNVRIALAGSRVSSTPENYANAAIESYKQALPWSVVYGRIGIVKQVLLHKSGLDDLSRVDSPKALKGLTKKQKMKAVRAATMWRRVYSGKPLSRPEAEKYARFVNELNLGVLKQAAVAEVYARAGMVKQANAALEKARSEAYRVIVIAFCLFGGLALMGVVGIGGLAWLLVRSEPPQSGFDSRAAFPAFIAYLLSSLVFTGLGAAVVSAQPAGSADLIVALIGNLAAFAIGLWVLRSRSAEAGADCGDIGFRSGGVCKTLWQGLLGYCGAIPVMSVAFVIAVTMQRTVFEHLPTQEHPVVPLMASGGAALWLAFVLAVVVAPVIEEIFFRGVLFRGLRSRMGLGGAAAFSAFVFASLHPTLPSGFLPIFTLGMVLAVLREKTGSLYPGMIAHALNNGIMLTLAMLLY